MIAKSLYAAVIALSLGAAAAEPLAFRIDEGRNINSFFRDGPVAAHIVLRSGNDPRLLVAFPAGNSGTGLWFAHLDFPAHWKLAAPPRPVTTTDGKGRPLYGVTFDVSIDTRKLQVKNALLSNVRVLRDYQSRGTVPAGIEASALTGERTMLWRRDRLDGAAGYQLRLAMTDGMIRSGQLEAGKSGRIALTVTALSGDKPLQPFAGDALLNNKAAPDERARQALSLLSYHEKFLAGSWRFNTYFGRDTLLSLRLLMPVLQPEAIADGLASVLTRLSANGEVAHEEDISEFAILDHLRTDHSASAVPVYDYKMIDESLLLAPVADAWLTGEGHGEAKDFLDAGRAAALLRNFRHVLREAEAFARDPKPGNLIGLKSGWAVGDWRDSEDGLGGGRYPYDVNAVLMPAALNAIAHLFASGLLDRHLAQADQRDFAGAAEMARVWRLKAPGFFALEIDGKRAQARIAAYAAELGIPAGGATPQGPVTVDALALDANGKPIPVIHSDIGFALLFSDPDAAALQRMLHETLQPFPRGLLSDAGLLVANPVFAEANILQRFGPNAYHGTVIWSWQQALFAAGLAHQLARKDLPADLRTELAEAQTRLWRVIEQTRAFANSELWSWHIQNGRLVPVPFGARSADADESDAVQLWSTVYLAVRNPRAAP